jgi:hypothetical protein
MNEGMRRNIGKVGEEYRRREEEDGKSISKYIIII